jgi:hypothetical protein
MNADEEFFLASLAAWRFSADTKRRNGMLLLETEGRSITMLRRSVGQFLAWRRQAIRWAEQSRGRFVCTWTVFGVFGFSLTDQAFRIFGMKGDGTGDAAVVGLFWGATMGWWMWGRVADRKPSN